MSTAEPAYLALADGTVFEGFSWGASGHTVGEVVFTTGMTGYEEVLTDPSYFGQLVTMTSPHIGNTGSNEQDPESLDHKPQAAGFIVRAPSPMTSNWRSNEGLDAHLAKSGIVAIGGIDIAEEDRRGDGRARRAGEIELAVLV